MDAHNETAWTDAGSEAQNRQVLFVTIGRQRVGKTATTNAIAEATIRQGGTPEIWNADTLNKSNSLSTFFPDAASPRHDATPAEQRTFLEQRFASLRTSGRDAILDIGGGTTALHDLIDTTPLADVLDEAGVTMVAAYVVGTEKADLDYLDSLMNGKLFLPTKTLIILNEGLVTGGRSPRVAFEPIFQHEVIATALEKGANIAQLPALTCMSEVTDRGLSYTDFANGKQADGFPPVSMFDKARVRRWFLRDFPAFLEQAGEEFLPRMPNGLPKPPEGVRL